MNNTFEQCTELKNISFPKLTTLNWINTKNTISIEAYYHIIFDKLNENVNDEIKAEYQVLLKLNDNNYRRTVLQIEYERGLADATNKTK